MRNLIQSSLNQPANLYSRDQKLRNQFNRIWLSNNPLKNLLGKFQTKQLLRKMKRHSSNVDDCVYILEDNSFPSDTNRKVGQGWDLFKLYGLIRQFAEIRLIVLNRNPIAATFSHKDWDGGFRPHADVIAKHLDYLASVIQKIEVSHVRNISYEDLSAYPIQTVKGIIEFLSLPNADHNSAYKDFKASKKNWRASLDPEEVQWAESVFYGERSKSLEILSNPEQSIIKNRPELIC